MQDSWLKTPCISQRQLQRKRQKHESEQALGSAVGPVHTVPRFGSGAEQALGSAAGPIHGGLIGGGHPVLRPLSQYGWEIW